MFFGRVAFRNEINVKKLIDALKGELSDNCIDPRIEIEQL